MNEGPIPFDLRAIIQQASDELFAGAHDLLKAIQAPHLVNQDILHTFGLVQLTCSWCGPIKSFDLETEAYIYHPDGCSDVEHFQDDHECFHSRHSTTGRRFAPDPTLVPREYFVPPSMAETQHRLRWELSRVLTEINEEWYPYSEPVWPWKECHGCL